MAHSDVHDVVLSSCLHACILDLNFSFVCPHFACIPRLKHAQFCTLSTVKSGQHARTSKKLRLDTWLVSYTEINGSPTCYSVIYTSSTRSLPYRTHPSLLPVQRSNIDTHQWVLTVASRPQTIQRCSMINGFLITYFKLLTISSLLTTQLLLMLLLLLLQLPML